MTRSRLGWIVTRIRRKIWFRAALITLVSLVTAAAAGALARYLPYEFTGDVGQNAVDTILQIVASSMLAVTTFSLTAMVSAYGSATQLATPRATQLMIGDRTSQNALSTFLGAFVFAIVGIVGLQTNLYGGQGRVVLLIATLLLIVLVVVTLLRWIAHIAAFGRMADVIDRVENAAADAMREFAADPYLGMRPAPAEPAGAPVFAAAIGYVTHIDVAVLARAAKARNLAIHVNAPPGSLVHAGRPLMYVDGACDGGARAALAKAFTIERHRSFDNDPRLGVIALAEIASRALSPAVNDPGTAIEVLNALLRTLSALPADRPCEPADRPAVYMPRPSTGELLDDAFLPIIRDGAGQMEVMLRALAILKALRATVSGTEAAVDRLIAAMGAAVARTQDDSDAVARFAAARAAA